MPRGKSLCYCINLCRAANAVTALYDGLLAPIGLTINQFSLLASLSTLGTSSISELAAYTGLDRTTLTRTLKPLLSQGYLQDQSLPGARNRALCLTQRGIRTLKEGLPLWRQAQSRLEEQLGQEGARWIYEVAEKL